MGHIRLMMTRAMILYASLLLAVASCSKQPTAAEAPPPESATSGSPSTPTPVAASRHSTNWGTDCVDASGPPITQNRSVGPFQGVDLRGSANVSFYQGPSRPIEVVGPAQALNRLTTEVVNGRLVVRMEGCVRNARPIQVRAWSAAPDQIRIAGSGDVSGKTPITGTNFDIHVAGSGDVDVALQVASVETQISGSGNVTLKGKADQQTVNIAGSGDLRGADLVTRETSARVVGSGDVKINATDTLEATLIGSGDLRHRGGATVRSRVIGSGSIKKL